MSITDPFLTCQCSRCGAEYYDERALLQEGHLSEDEEPKRLLRKILERFDTCIYCHGKFKA